MNPRLFSSIERLEDRIAPAGLITAALISGHLQITGDSGDHSIDLSFLDPSTAVLAGHNGTSFLVNGKVETGPVTISGVTDGIRALFGSGNDTVQLGPGNFPGSVSLDLGDGDNTVITSQLAVASHLSVKSGAGADRIVFGGRQTAVGGDLSLDLGDGNNSVASSLGAFVVSGNLNVKTGTGNDRLLVGGSEYFIGGDATVTTGGGVDTVAFVATNIGAFGGKLSLSGGSGSGQGEQFDFGGQEQLIFRGAIAIKMGAGDGWLALHSGRNVHAQSDVSIDTGHGADQASITAPSVAVDGNVVVKALGGVDLKVAATENLQIKGNVNVTGGSGTDKVAITGGGEIDGTVDVNTGAGDNQVITLAGANGKDLVFKKTVNLTQGGTNGISVTTVSDAQFLAALNISSASAADTVRLVRVALDGGITVSTGTGADVLDIAPLALPLQTSGNSLAQLADNGRAIAAIIAGAGLSDLAASGGSVLDGAGTVDLTSAGLQNDLYHQALAPLSAELAR